MHCSKIAIKFRDASATYLHKLKNKPIRSCSNQAKTSAHTAHISS